MKATSSSSSIIDWSKFDDLPSERQMGMDIVAAQRRLDKGRQTPLRWRRGCFRCPADATEAQRWKFMEQAVKVFVSAMAKQGWELRSQITVLDSPYPALELSDKPEDTKVMPGYKEYILRAVFEKIDFKPLRIELPPELIRPS